MDTMSTNGNTFGKSFCVTTFGESHGVALGCVIDGCPAGIELTKEMIQAALNRRRPGSSVTGEVSASVTARKEADEVEILSGVFNGRTTGTPIALEVRNTSQHSGDYGNLDLTFRPGHADFTYDIKYKGNRDYRGGGRSSGRETLARVAAGAVAQQVLAQKGIKITAYTIRAAGISAEKRDLSQIEQNNLRAPDNEAAAKMNKKIEELRAAGDSAGGVIECLVTGCPAGLGEPRSTSWMLLLQVPCSALEQLRALKLETALPQQTALAVLTTTLCMPRTVSLFLILIIQVVFLVALVTELIFYSAWQ